MNLSDRALAAIGAPPRSAALTPSSATAQDDYPGVIVTDGDFRLAVSPKGGAYLAQVRRHGAWCCTRPFLKRETLAFYVTVIDGPWPDKILAAVAELPRDPEECAAILLSGKRAG